MPTVHVAGAGSNRRPSDFQTMVIRSRLFATILDLCQKGHTVIGERWRTKANETEKERRAPQPAAGRPEGGYMQAVPTRWWRLPDSR